MRLWTVVFLAGSLIAACGQSAGNEDEIVVSAASSLTDVFIDLETVFESSNPGFDVVLNLGASSLLREQLLGGAPADVFASASTEIMDQVVAAGLVNGDPRVFAVNRLQIAVPSGNPADVSGMGDFARADLLIGLCAEGVPCGDFARVALERAGVSPVIDTHEPNARALLVKLEEGELDAGITYATDVIASESVDGLDISENVNVLARYPIAVVGNGSNRAGADEFVAFVLSQAGRDILARHGFLLP